MAAIFGFVGPNEKQNLRDMGNEIKSRGKEEYIYFNNGIGLGQRSPEYKTLTNEVDRFNKKFVVLFDGDVLNELELRNTLEEKGHDLSRSGLSDVLVCMFHEYGSDFPKHLMGPFALAIYCDDQIILARDGLGVRPLFYFRNEKNLFFASEIKAIKCGAGAALKLDRESLYERFVFRDHVIGDSTYFKDVKQVPPGDALIFSARDPSRAPEDRHFGQIQKKFPEPDTEEYRDIIRKVLEDSIRYYTRRGESVGVLLSGGFDSSVLAALAVKHAPAGTKIKTFTISDDPDYPDVVAARQVAAHLGTDHHQFIVRLADQQDLETGIYAYEDVIFRDTIFMLAKNINGSVDAVISGAGADVFGMPVLLRDRLESIALKWARVQQRDEVSSGSLRLHGYMKWFMQGLEDELWTTAMTHFTNDYMPNQLYPSTERSFAYYGMESYFPYAHPQLKMMATSLPKKFHNAGDREKPVLRDAFSDLDLPPDILSRPTLCSKSNFESVKRGLRQMARANPNKVDLSQRKAKLVRGDYLDFCLSTLERQFTDNEPGSCPPRFD